MDLFSLKGSESDNKERNWQQKLVQEQVKQNLMFINNTKIFQGALQITMCILYLFQLYMITTYLNLKIKRQKKGGGRWLKAERARSGPVSMTLPFQSL